MIIEFSLGNYRSFKDVQTLSFKATGLVSDEKNRDLDTCNVIEIDGNRILKSIGLYGPNGSGKSNLLRGLAFMQYLVSASLETENILKNFIDYFRLTEDENNSFFQIILLIDGKKYRYGFTIGRSENIQAEWLFGPADRNETYYFKRTGQEIEVNSERFSEGDNIPRERLRTDALFLSFVSSYDGAISGAIRSFMTEKIVIDSQNKLLPASWKQRQSPTYQLISSGKKSIVIDRMYEAGIFYTDLRLEKVELRKGDFYEFVVVSKNIYNEKGEVQGRNFFWLDDESSGTQKYFDYIGEFYRLFEEGGIYISDEIDNNFHPSLLRKIVAQFHDPALNKKGAQLLFSSHDTNLMDPTIMRRDQFYFTEKTTTDYSRLYSLADLKGIRNNADFARQYLSGMYGALPLLHDMLQNDSQENEI